MVVYWSDFSDYKEETHRESRGYLGAWGGREDHPFGSPVTQILVCPTIGRAEAPHGTQSVAPQGASTLSLSDFSPW